ncbi:deoxyribose-phosphate aldolase [Conchiformibius steedae]|nr:deoxyribose-phosphate aldolase [Conchiformibius steedae]
MKAKILSLMDLTSLNEDDTPERIRSLCAKAVQPIGKVAAVCVYPHFVALTKQELAAHPDIAIATVVNFPSGQESSEQVLADTRQVLADGANEIDLVFPYRDFAAGNQQTAAELTAAVAKLCREANAKLKVILETGELDAATARAAADCALANGADFLKTSTGKTPHGASPEAAEILLAAIAEADKSSSAGIKLSGGVRDIAAAEGYIRQAEAAFGADWVNPAHFRIGASALLDALLAA